MKIRVPQRLTTLFSRAVDLQRIQRFDQRLRAWTHAAGLRRPRALQRPPLVTNDGQAASATPPATRPVFPIGKRPVRSLEQLYDEVDAAHVVRLHHFHQFLDAKQILLDARQTTQAEEVAAVVAPSDDAAADAGDPLMDAAGWDEDVDGGRWEGDHAEHA